MPLPLTLLSSETAAQSLLSAGPSRDAPVREVPLPETPVEEAMTLGATLYVPILNPGIVEIIAGRKYPGLKSVVLCLEDALRVADDALGLRRLTQILAGFGAAGQGGGRPRLFLRPRNLAMAEIICALPGIARIDGLVAPKIALAQVAPWWALARATDLRLMPTLESAWVFDPGALAEFAAAVEEQPEGPLLAIRVGGNDLLATLRLRRMRGETIYDGPLAWGLSQIMCQLGARGLPLTAPVFDVLDDPVTLAREATRDAGFGFVGKTAVHPDQIDAIHRGFAVTRDEVSLAREVLRKDAAAVSRASGVMLEPATHHGWATRVLSRAAVYGIVASD